MSSIACSPVKQKLDKDNKDTHQHDHPHQDEAPTEHGEAVGLWLTVLVKGEITIFAPWKVSMDNVYWYFVFFRFSNRVRNVSASFTILRL